MNEKAGILELRFFLTVHSNVHFILCPTVRPYHGKFAGEDMVGFMFLVEVALGREKSISERHSHLIEAPPGYDCVVARGAREPGN